MLRRLERACLATRPLQRIPVVTVAHVYAKTLIPGPHPIPALMATTDDADTLMPQLTDRGWVPFGDPIPTAAAGQLVVEGGRLQLVVDDQALLDDLNPWAPMAGGPPSTSCRDAASS